MKSVHYSSPLDLPSSDSTLAAFFFRTFLLEIIVKGRRIKKLKRGTNKRMKQKIIIDITGWEYMDIIAVADVAFIVMELIGGAI